MASTKRISQLTGEIIDDNSSEAGFVVNMDDPKTDDFIARVKSDNKARKAKEDAGKSAGVSQFATSADTKSADTKPVTKSAK